MKVASFTVGATQEQAIRWKRAAEADGHRAVGSWLAVAADLYLKVRAGAGAPIALAWHWGAFRVSLEDGSTPTLRGSVSPPFGIYRGTANGPRRGPFVLVYVPAARSLATLRHQAQCKALAAELAPALLREDRELAAGIINRHERESV